MRTSFSTKLAMALAITVTTGTVFAESDSTKTESNTASTSIAIDNSTVVFSGTVEGQKIEITLGQIKEQLDTLPPQIKNAPFQEVYPFLLDNASKLSTIKIKATKLGLDKDEKVKKSVAQCQEAVVQKAFLDQEIEKRQTEAELRKAYDEVVKILPPTNEVLLGQAIFAKEDQAKAFLKEAGKEGFDKAFSNAKEKNPDLQGGTLDYVRADALPPQLATKVNAAAKKTLVKEVIKIEANGATIYLVTEVKDKRPAKTPTYEQLKEELKMLLAQKLMKEVLDDVTKDLKVEKRIGLDGKPLPELSASAPTANKAKAEDKKDEAKSEEKK